jgi:hypothetical protein
LFHLQMPSTCGLLLLAVAGAVDALQQQHQVVEVVVRRQKLSPQFLFLISLVLVGLPPTLLEKTDKTQQPHFNLIHWSAGAEVGESLV